MQALLDAIHQINWVDIVVLTLLFRIGYIALENGFSQEIFKLSGTALAAYLSLHSYLSLTNAILGFDRSGALEGQRAAFEFAFFLLLAIAGYFIFVFLRKGFYRLVKLEAVPRLNKWGGLLLGCFRAFLAVSLLLFTLCIAPFDYPKTSVQGSYASKYLIRIAPAAYSWLWNSLVSKFMTGSELNVAVFEVQDSIIAVKDK